MKPDKTTIALVGLCVILLLAWTPLMRRMGFMPTAPEPAPKAAQSEAPSGQGETPAPPVAGTSLPDGAGDAVPAVAPDSPASGSTGGVLPSVGPGFSEPAHTRPMTLPGVFSVELAKDSGIVTVHLDRYKAEDHRTPVALGNWMRPYCALVLPPEWREGEGSTFVRHDPDHVAVEHPLPTAEGTITESWELVPDSLYEVTYRVTVRNDGSEPLELPGFGITCGTLETGAGGRSSSRSSGVDGAVDVMAVDAQRPRSLAAKRLRKEDPETTRELAETAAQWIAVHSKYFIFYLRPESGTFAGCIAGAEEAGAPGEETTWVYGTGLVSGRTVAPGAEVAWQFHGYVGPKEYKRLREIGGGLDGTLGMDLFLFWHPRWMAVITGAILWSLIALNRFFGHAWGYGFAIIVVTFVVKMVFWPLTHRSTVSMRRMQGIQPVIKELREKYKDQPEKLNRKTMEVYREHKVSPLGGCLPMVLQIPVFFALFNTFRSAIELRQASFLWVADLSMPDTLPFSPEWLPIRPLAILMGGTMLLQQKLTPTSPDPSQARMMTFMSVFFMFIFYTMPAGLTLYWTVNQILTIMQNVVSRKLGSKEAA